MYDMEPTAVVSAAIGYALVRWTAFVLPLRAHYAGSVIVATQVASLPDAVRALADRHRVVLVEAEKHACNSSYHTLDSGAACPFISLARYRQLAAICAPFKFCLSVEYPLCGLKPRPR